MTFADFIGERKIPLIVSFSNNTTAATSREGTAYPVGSLGTTPGF